jgi:hypothetical protein
MADNFPSPRGIVPTGARYEPGSKTIRSVPENYWLVTVDSWDSAVNHDASARVMARSFRVAAAARALLDAFGGDVPDWLAGEAAALEAALTTDITR